MGRGEYTVKITSALDLLILTEGGILGNKQSTNDNLGGRGGHNQKGHMGHTFVQKRHGYTEENVTLVPGRDVTTLNAPCYNCHNPGNLS